jgi:hypothetical protein
LASILCAAFYLGAIRKHKEELEKWKEGHRRLIRSELEHRIRSEFEEIMRSKQD